ncbi:unnamed protein product [Phaedon cochleariae]|uniref:Uncharacterized protein n=1 Tax=Phaedon cochleariae TaxID=80249 RepID=A0A9P0DVP9_PHACE|nr:unnamed protein product [Phaedon cochleariae]
MDSELPQENLAEKRESSPKVSINENTDSTKNEQKVKTRSKRRRSRSHTPQTKTDDTASKTLQISLKKLDEEVNNKDIIQENGKASENGSQETPEEVKTVEDRDKNKVEAEVSKDDEVMEVPEEVSEEIEVVILEKDTSEKVVSSDKVVSPKKIVSPKKVITPKKVVSNKKEKVSKQPVELTVDNQDSVEMEPLVISDEPDPELQFDENSDIESGKGSPVISRCNTRRSQTRNIPTPKSPKLAEQHQDPENKPVTIEETNSEQPIIELSDSDSADMANSSTRAEVGSDYTRLDYTETNNSVPEDSSYLNEVRERSVTETLRCLSSRRPIRGDYRRIVFRNAHEKSELNLQSRDSIENVQTGVKRKDRSVTPEEPKKFRGDTSGLFSSPFAGFRNKFKSELPSSTPKLLGYKDIKSGLQYEEGIATDRNAGEKSWCAIM